MDKEWATFGLRCPTKPSRGKATLDFVDRCPFSASLHLALRALGIKAGYSPVGLFVNLSSGYRFAPLAVAKIIVGCAATSLIILTAALPYAPFIRRRRRSRSSPNEPRSSAS
ncbi:MAG: hypothetical protein IKB89_04540 [Clostridia bacterium]|nr:hypothetical protein [Clostridia bacterium]